MPWSAYGGGGIWVAEISYDHEGHRHTGYVLADIWVENDPDLLVNDSLFDAKIRHLHTSSDTLMIYRHLTDREQLAGKALFPMHPFLLNRDSVSFLCISDIGHMSLNRIWKRNDYDIRVLSEISLSDSSWVSDKELLEPIIYPVGEEVGCRLEVYDFNPSFDPSHEMNEITRLYNQGYPVTGVEEIRLQEIIHMLKEKRIIVVELCGC